MKLFTTSLLSLDEEFRNMSTSDLLSLIAIIIASISLLLQRRDANKQLLVANFSTYTKRYQEVIEKLPSCIVSDSFNIDEISDEDKEKVLRYMWIYFDLCAEEFFLHKQKLIPDNVWGIWKSGMLSSFARPSFQQCWLLIKTHSQFPSEFVRFIDSSIQRSTNNRSIRRGADI